jgi:hypothetical protein
MISERDAIFISDFIDNPIEKEKRWMLKYFKTKTKKMFLKYFLIFNNASRFKEHCGEICSKRDVKKIKKQFVVLLEKHDEAKKNFDIDLLEKIEKGKFKLKLI